MALLNGMHHLTFLTADLDRLIDFYGRIFDARVTLDLEEEGLRHAFIQIGPTTVLHPFQVPGIGVPEESAPMFQRGRIDHFALNAASEDALREIYRRLIGEGRYVSEVTDMGSMLLFTFEDPDGAHQEVGWAKPGVPVEQGIRRSEWTVVTIE